ncbi:MAG: TetR/AcrR family transcriptional regulator [Phenylobacterium sp.]|uniref:TetR/AcrR family transcriptional regulator n=1 Tax=Phenylobacterium sp. TaxID=1871053 RepID=UPI00391DABAA
MRVNLPARAAAAQQRRAKTRERLLDAASRLIADKGPDAASVEDIAAAAGVSRGTFYNYFPTTDDLIHALNTRSAQAILAPLGELARRIEDPALRLAAAAHLALVSMIADPTRAWVLLRLEGSRAPRQTPSSQFMDRLFEAGVSAGQFSGIDLDAARSFTLGALRNAARDLLLEGASCDLGEHVVAMILRGLGMPEAQARAVSAEGRAMAGGFALEAA